MEMVELTTIKFVVEFALQESLMIQEAFGRLGLCNTSLTKSWGPPNLLDPLGLFIHGDGSICNRRTIFARNCTLRGRGRQIILIRSTVILYAEAE